jgi:hypothetical protein
MPNPQAEIRVSTRGRIAIASSNANHQSSLAEARSRENFETRFSIISMMSICRSLTGEKGTKGRLTRLLRSSSFFRREPCPIFRHTHRPSRKGRSESTGRTKRSRRRFPMNASVTLTGRVSVKIHETAPAEVADASSTLTGWPVNIMNA